MSDLCNKVRSTIMAHKLIEQGDKVLVALSGGADSVCLLHILLALSEEMNFSVYAAHVNHGLRGEESEGDEAFVQDLCNRLSLPLFIHDCDVRAFSEERHIGLEEGGRLVRYDFFYSLVQDKGMTKIATAHHGDDNVETVLMRLIRGTGPVGLAGIPYQNRDVIRPFLDVSRAEIEAYMSENQLEYRTDSTNADIEFTRNRIRNQLIPFVKQQFNPNFQNHFREQIKLYRDCAFYIEEEINKRLLQVAEVVLGGYGFSCDALSKEPPFIISQLLHRIISEVSGGKETGAQAVRETEEILRQKKGQVSLAKDVVAQVYNGTLYIRKEETTKPFCHPVEPCGTQVVQETGGKFIFSQVTCVPEKAPKDTIYLELSKLKDKQLFVRSRRPGDYFYPIGMAGKKSLQDYFVDCKIPCFMRDFVPILCTEDEILWIAGMRQDARYAATKDKNEALCIRYIRSETNETIGR
ncbi:MAG: tRNA lysidine(34) synthetase TilS [Clostridia bacterium]|nr:tRNA lysidine(34) synthetase TilS [Clostridia bacterium]